jgi:hypothetical protein
VSDEGKEELLCPSGRCAVGSQLIGIVGPDGRLGYVDPPLEIDATFIEVSSRGRAPESRFRFAEPCLGHHCEHWTHDQCGLIGRLSAGANELALTESSKLPRCGIRRSCRWFRQRGPEACEACPHVVRQPRLPAAATSPTDEAETS